jgi:hypothetical protein
MRRASTGMRRAALVSSRSATDVGLSGPTWLFRWSKSLGQAISFKDDPEPPAWVTAMFNR